MHTLFCTNQQLILQNIIYIQNYNAATEGGSLVLDLESAADVAEPEASVVLDEFLFFSSFSELLSTSIGSSLSSFAPTPFVVSEFSLDFLAPASVGAFSTVPLVFVADSLAVPVVLAVLESDSFLFPDFVGAFSTVPLVF